MFWVTSAIIFQVSQEYITVGITMVVNSFILIFSRIDIVDQACYSPCKTVEPSPTLQLTSISTFPSLDIMLPK